MILCNKMEKSPLYVFANARIIVSSIKVVKGSLFSSNYVVYSIECKDLDSSVLRRYRDFDWLRNELRNLYPGVFVRML